MSRDLTALLEATAPPPGTPIDPATIRARSWRRTARTRLTAAAGGVLLLATTAVVWPANVVVPTIEPATPDAVTAPEDDLPASPSNEVTPDPVPDAPTAPDEADPDDDATPGEPPEPDDPPTATTPDPAPRPDGDASPTTQVPAQLVADHPVRPEEWGDEFADIVTRRDDLRRAWHRFRLPDPPPQVDLDRSALLFVAFHESGSCPERLGAVTVDGRRVRLVSDAETEGGCTADARPRTWVVEVDRSDLPPDGFGLTLPTGGAAALATAPLAEPPADPAPVDDRFTDERVALRFGPATRSVAGGETVRLGLANDGDTWVGRSSGSTDGFGAGDPLHLHRWSGQRWLPEAPGDLHADHPAVTARDVRLEPGERALLATVATDGLAPGWYRAGTGVGLGGRGGRVPVRTAFEVRP